jgi:hypothetical protein
LNFKNKKIILLLVSNLSLFFIAMGSLNYLVDPRSYLLTQNETEAKVFYQHLEDSKHGLRLPRSLSLPKYMILKNRKIIKSVVVGTSQTYGIGQNYSSVPLGIEADSLFNLSLSGMGLNEVVFFFNTSLDRGVKKVFIAIPHHLYSFNNYNRWPESIKEKMKGSLMEVGLGAQHKTGRSSLLTTLDYLFSIKTFWESYDHFLDWQSDVFKKHHLRELNRKPNVNQDFVSFFLKNGATSWSKKDLIKNLVKREVISEKVHLEIKNQIVTFELLDQSKINKKIQKLKKIFSYYKKQGIIIELYIPPLWLPYFIKKKDSSTLKFLYNYEKEVIHLGKELGLDVFGGINLCPSDMNDPVHPNFSCLERAIKYPID